MIRTPSKNDPPPASLPDCGKGGFSHPRDVVAKRSLRRRSNHKRMLDIGQREIEGYGAQGVKKPDRDISANIEIFGREQPFQNGSRKRHTPLTNLLHIRLQDEGDAPRRRARELSRHDLAHTWRKYCGYTTIHQVKSMCMHDFRGKARRFGRNRPKRRTAKLRALA